MSGDTVTVTGYNFPKQSTRPIVMFGENYSETIISYDTDKTPNEIKCIVPEARTHAGEPYLQDRADKSVNVVLTDSSYYPLFSSYVSNSKKFTYNKPSLQSINPSFVISNKQVTLYGENFGPYQKTLGLTDERVLFGSSYADVISWTNNKIVVNVPDDYGLGLGAAKDAFFFITLGMKAAKEKVVGFGIAILKHFMPELHLVEFKFDVNAPFLTNWYQLFLVIFEPKIFSIKPTGDITMPVSVINCIGESNPCLFTFKPTDIVPTDIEGSFIEHLASPGELRVYDSGGGVTGWVDGVSKEEIPESVAIDNTIFVWNATDSYTHAVVGTDAGTYGLTLAYIRNGEFIYFDRVDISTSNKQMDIYSINLDDYDTGGEIAAMDTYSSDGTLEQHKTFRSPIAAFTYNDKAALADNPITFDASASYDNDGTIVSYSWDFGDEHTSSGVSITHTYHSLGDYTVVLTITDNDGVQSTHSTQIHIEKAKGIPVWLWLVIGIVSAMIALITVMVFRIYLKRRTPQVIKQEITNEDLYSS